MGTNHVKSIRGKLLRTGLFLDKSGLLQYILFKHNPNQRIFISSHGKISFHARHTMRTYWEMSSFQEIFDNAPKEIQEKMIYHMDLFLESK